MSRLTRLTRAESVVACWAMISNIFNCSLTMYPSEIWFKHITDNSRIVGDCKDKVSQYRREHGAPGKNMEYICLHWISASQNLSPALCVCVCVVLFIWPPTTKKNHICRLFARLGYAKESLGAGIRFTGATWTRKQENCNP
jgi:hypothetical protein